MRKILFVLLSVVFLSTTAFAQGYDPRRTIAVTGTSELKVVPDEVVISMNVETNDMSLDKARAANDEKVSSIIAMIKKLGVDEKYIQTDYMHVEPRFDNRYNTNGVPSERDFLGYFMTKSITVTLKDISKYEKLIAEALKLGTNYVSGATFQLSTSRKVRDQVRLEAIKAAKEKAVALAAELGQKVGKPITILENTPIYPTYDRKMVANSYGYANGDVSGDNGSVSAGLITVEATINVMFELE